MAVQTPRLSIDGDIPLASRKRYGESLMDGVQPVSGDPARAARMQAQLQQPVTGPRGSMTPVSAGVPTPRAPEGILSGLAGGAKVVAGGAALPFATGIDAARQGIASLAGGDPNTLPGGPSRFSDAASATLQQGIGQAAEAASGVRAGVRSALGVQTAQGGIADGLPVTPAEASTAAVSQPARSPGISGETAAPGANDGGDFMRTGIGGDRAGGEIVGRRGANGVMEFTNEAATPGSVASARAMPAGGMGRVGDGIGGGLSVGAPGDAQLALDRFERANQERRNMIDISRRGEIGEGGGRVTIVRDSSRSPSLADIQNARLDARQAQTDGQRQQTQQGILSGIDDRLTSQLQRQRTQQELDTGNIALTERQRLAQLGAMLADPNVGAEQRAEARQAYNVLATQAKDRYIAQDVVLGQGNNGPVIGRQIIDVTTGQPVAGSAGQKRTGVTRAEVEQAAQEDGVSVDDYIKALAAQGVVVS